MPVRPIARSGQVSLMVNMSVMIIVYCFTAIACDILAVPASRK